MSKISVKRHSIILFIVIAVLLQFGCKKSINSSDIDVEAEILKEMQDNRIPSVVAAIVKDNEIVWEGTFGLADVESSKPTDRLTLYNIESISKLFVSISVFQLWEDDRIDLYSDINEYLPFTVRNPNYPDIAITPHMLLNHTSSLAWPVQTEDHLPDFEYFFDLDNVPPISEWIPQYILANGLDYRPAVWKDFRPGSQELYSNIGVSLLALIIENITGMDYRDYCRENILLSLDMENSAFRPEYMNEELLVTPYYNSNYPVKQFTYRHYPAGNIKSNIVDFSHFISAILNFGELNGNRILKPETVEQMFKINNYATGMSNLWNRRLGNRIAKYGGGTGYSAFVEWQFDSDIGFIIFSNKYNESVYPHGRIYDLIRYQSNNY
ncbi:serine hydrolase domain-containing protein [Candidatus Neomarinimicrobiota bacterium]